MIGDDDEDIQGIPPEFICPITMEVMRDPVIAADGFSYERADITRWLNTGGRNSPKTGAPLAHIRLTSNNQLRILIQEQLPQIRQRQLIEQDAIYAQRIQQEDQSYQAEKHKEQIDSMQGHLQREKETL